MRSFYSFFVKISEKFWERDIPKTAELDSVFTHSFDIPERMRGKSRAGFDTLSSKDDHSYLVVGKMGL